MTQTAQHTPGPWSYLVIENKYHDERGKLITVATVFTDKIAIARCHKVEDAKFIAAAPGMAEALKEAAEYFWQNGINDKARRCDAALAKAGV